MGMATYEELLEIIKMQQTTIEKLTTEYGIRGDQVKISES